MKQLIDIELDIEYACPKIKDVHIMNCIDALVKHSSIRNIKLCIYDLPDKKLEIFDKLVQLNQLKPNVQIEILIHDWPSERQKVLEKRNKFWEIKQKTNLNMKFSLYTDHILTRILLILSLILLLILFLLVFKYLDIILNTIY